MTKEAYRNLFESFNHFNVLIVGDVMVDSYLWGKVERISPEAPVPIVSVTKRENRLGGAANVALNIKSMGANPIIISVIGNDQKGEEFLEMLKAANMQTNGIVLSHHRITTTKFRVIGNKSQLLRVDEESEKYLDVEEFDSLIQRFEKIIAEKKIDVIIFQDYDKGVISEDLISKIVESARTRKIPVAVDPKKRNFTSYRNVTLFKPNLKELREGLKLDFDAKQKESLAEAVSQLKRLLNPEMVLVTLSEDGVYIDYKTNGEKNVLIIPSHVRSISDVSGAGDTVISVAALCLAANADPSEMARLANLAGGLVCEKAGVVPIHAEQLFNEAVKLGD